MENIAKALNKFQTQLPKVKLDATVSVKTKSGGSYDFKYATLGNIIDTVLPPLVKNGLSFSQTFVNGTLNTTLYHVSGEKIESYIPLEMNGCTMQEIGSRISYLKRYSLSAMLGIVAEEDDDANIADGNTYKKSKVQSKNISWDQVQKNGFQLGLDDDSIREIIKWWCSKLKIDMGSKQMFDHFLDVDKFDKTRTDYFMEIMKNEDSSVQK